MVILRKKRRNNIPITQRIFILFVLCFIHDFNNDTIVGWNIYNYGLVDYKACTMAALLTSITLSICYRNYNHSYHYDQ